MQNTNFVLKWKKIIKLQLQSNYNETVYLKLFSIQESLLLTTTISKGWKSSTEPPSGSETGGLVNIWNFSWSKVLLSSLEASGIFNLSCLVVVFQDISICSHLKKSQSIFHICPPKKNSAFMCSEQEPK